ncbi:LysR family transcriptional regulator [Litoreibacter roseus]|uniref:LysR family transcriptional regulator n=1 Tax=Litoreibacter roseus TaxID=2601869 RepID=A0A6N6JD48_9RHOB|nr:LysR family transcriptional regulator [Litoreibacter roseus]GFE64096.1 LysR family transcriptional regulator [Litoreibacter roseus]
MNLRSLKVFSLVMEEGTLGRAADRMHLSQSAASRLLQILEEEFAVQLFRRDKKRLIPTEEGERFYPEALRILSQIEDIPSFFSQVRSGKSEPLRVICHSRIVNGLVIPAIAEMAKRREELPIKLEIHPRRDLGRQIMNGRYDIGISVLPLPVDTLKPIQLGKTDLRIAIARGHPLADRQSLGPDDVKHLPYIALDETTAIRRIVDRECERAGISLKIQHEVSAGSAAYRLVYLGLGYTFADPVAVDPEISDGIRLIPWKPAMQVEFGCFVTPNRKDRSDIEQFSAVLREIIEPRLKA